MNRRIFAAAAGLWSASLALGLSIRALRARDAARASSASFVPAPGSLFNLSSPWTSDAGTAIQLSALAGSYTVVALIFTRCGSVCPTLVQQLRTAERRMPQRTLAQTRFALFSIDPQHDTAPILRQYRARMGLDARRWTLATSSRETVRELGAVLGFNYNEAAGGSPTHSKLVTVLDRAGRPLLQRADIGADPELLGRAIAAAMQAEGTG